jgi:hypothetical protein
MALICARCGTQNPDGNQFCQACGTPLAVPGASPFVGPPGGLPSPPTALPGPPMAPPPPPAGYQSPYYSPSAVGPQPPVHRTPWTLIIAAVVVLVLVMVGIGTGIALLGARANNHDSASGILPSPSPAGTPSPVTTPTPATTSSGTASNQGETFTLPSGWTVQSQDSETITITNPNGNGSVSVGSGPSSPTQTAQQNKDTIDKFFIGKYPDTKTCAGSKTTNGSLDGASGIFWELCFTLSSGGQSIQAGAPLFAGANADGSVYYVVLLLTSQSNMKAFIAEAAPILQSIQWKLS